MKIKLVRKQKYTIETHQEIEIDIKDIQETSHTLYLWGDLDNLFYDSTEMIMSGDELQVYQQPDNFDYEGWDIMIDDGDEYLRIDSYRSKIKDDLQDWSELPKTSIKDYLRNKKIDNLLK